MYTDVNVVDGTETVARVRAANPALKDRVNPSILNTKRDPNRTTEHYTETDDVSVIETLNAHGWFIKEYNELRPHKHSRQGYQKYLAVYENEDLTFQTEKGKARLLQIGSHDGTKPLIINAGFFTFACANGCIIGDNLFDPISVKHIGELPMQVEEAVSKFVDAVPLVFRKVDQMVNTQINVLEAHSFVREAVKLRFKDENAVQVDDVLKVHRAEDDNNSLWSVFQRVQENLIKSYDGFKAQSTNNKTRKVRSITNIDANVRINKGLWQLAEQFLR